MTFSRAQALQAAQQFQQQFPALKTDRSAAVFVSDRHLQNYVELEAGGVKAFQQLISFLQKTFSLRRIITMLQMANRAMEFLL